MLLDEIIKNKALEVAKLDPPGIKKPFSPRDFRAALKKSSRIKLIAEIKKRSPSAGVIRKNFNPAELAKTYEKSGAAAISVLTDKKFFGGSLDDLKQARKACSLPVLRKDFIIDPKQIYESKAAGADAILLIVKALGPKKLREFLKIAGELKMDALVEAHTQDEVDAALEAGSEIIGINNRDLQTFKINSNNTFDLVNNNPGLKNKIVVSESGIESSEQIELLRQAGVSAVLIGEALLKADNIPQKISALIKNKL